MLLVTKKQQSKLDKLHLRWKDIFLDQKTLLNNKTKDFSKFTIDFSEQRETLKRQFEVVNEIAHQTDPSFLGAAKAQEVKQLKGLDNLEKRLLKAEKRIHNEKLERIVQIQNQLFPNQGLQERTANFSSFCEEIDSFDSFLDKLQNQLHPLEQHFSVVIL